MQPCDDQGEANKLLEYIRQFQEGNFQKKKEFANYFLSSSNWQVFVVGMRLFMAVADHGDFELLQDFMSQWEEEQLRVFLAFVQESLSLHAIPYLLALYEEWDDTGVEKDIARCICGMLGQRYYDEEEYHAEQLGELFVDFTKEHDINQFYYNGKVYFPGDLTKSIMEIVMTCRYKKVPFYTDQLPAILSNSTGIKCPVSYGVMIDDSIIRALFDYIDTISKLQQARGEKYFYRHQILTFV